MPLEFHAGQLGHAGLDRQWLPFFDDPNSHVYPMSAGRAVAETLLSVKRLSTPGTFTRRLFSPFRRGTAAEPWIINSSPRNLPLDRQPKGCIMCGVMDAVFKALADESRRKLLDQLHKSNGQTLGELCEHLDMTRQAVTKHLLLLEAANLVAVVWRGREKLHYLNPVPLQEIYGRWVEKYERHRLRALGDLKKGLEQNQPNQKKG